MWEGYERLNRASVMVKPSFLSGCIRSDLQVIQFVSRFILLDSYHVCFTTNFKRQNP